MIVIILGGGYYIYITYFAPTTPSTIANQPLPISRTDWNQQLFNRPEYTDLTSPIPLPFVAGTVGNPNPFIEVK